MSTPTRLADDFASIKAALEKIESDKKPGEMPKAWPDFTPVDQVYGEAGEVWGNYVAPDSDPA